MPRRSKVHAREEIVFRKLLLAAGAAALSIAATVNVVHAEKVKIALIEGLSGPFAANGLAALRELEFASDQFLAGKEVGGSKLEVEILGLDGQVNPKETLVQLQKAISQGVSYVVAGQQLRRRPCHRRRAQQAQ